MEGWRDEEWKLKRDERKERELVPESGSVQEVIRGLKDGPSDTSDLL